jgi:hypothetical protein
MKFYLGPTRNFDGFVEHVLIVGRHPQEIGPVRRVERGVLHVLGKWFISMEEILWLYSIPIWLPNGIQITTFFLAKCDLVPIGT